MHSLTATLRMNSTQDVADFCNYLYRAIGIASWEDLIGWGVLIDPYEDSPDEDPETWPEMVLPQHVHPKLPLGIHFIQLEKGFDRTGPTGMIMWRPIPETVETPEQFIFRAKTNDELFLY